MPDCGYSEIVKRKRTPLASAELGGPVVPEVILEQAKRAIESDRLRKPARCTVCTAEVAPGASENLCWVCRRLKLSAWRDADSQMPAQE